MPLRHDRHALVTGASSGIGAAIAREYASRGVPTILVARRRERLEALARDLSAGAPSIAIAEDLADPGAPARLHATLAERGLRVGILVNNAGYGVPGRYLSSDWKVHADFLQVMQTAVAELTWRFLPAMEADGWGRILNVASLAGLVPSSAGHTLYGANKAWLIRFSEALALEMVPKGVHVTALCPGFTYSEFHDVNGMRAQVSTLPSWMWMDAATVARQAYDAVMAGRIIYVNGRVNRAMVLLARYLPQWLVLAAVKRVSGSYRKL